MIDLNPLDVLGSRKMDRIPLHFSKTKLLEQDLFNSGLENWVKNTLKGRYGIKKMPTINKDGNLTSSTFIGFEDEKELTYFMLACPHLRRN